jgi:hypothetical protein
VPDVDAIEALFATLIQPDVLLTHGSRDGDGDGESGEVSIVFQCYQGHRRSAVGMAVACLVRHNHERLYAAADASAAESDRGNVDDANTGTFADLVNAGAAQSDHGAVASPAADADLASPAAAGSASIMSPDASVPPVSGALSDAGALDDVRSVVITVSGGDGRVSIQSAGRSSLALATSPTGSAHASPALGAAPVDANTVAALPSFALGATATESSSSVAIPSTASAANSMAKTPSSSNLQQLQHQQHQQHQHHQQRGNFRGMIGLCRMLKHGRAVKDEVDAVLDACGGTVYIHEAIERSRTQVWCMWGQIDAVNHSIGNLHFDDQSLRLLKIQIVNSWPVSFLVSR